ncbi:MAG TPA: hypothetical protein VNH45_00525 [Gaiellaceae bacterium]|nr:hypothetical protein [Gaiellaceae bacterium]
MRAVAALLLGVALGASACGASKPSPSAADVAPRGTEAFVSLVTTPEAASTRRALALLPGGAQAQALLDNVGWAGIAQHADVAILGAQGSVAFALPSDRGAFEKRLDGAGLLHARIRGWTAFTFNSQALETAKRAKERLADAPWYAPAARAATGAERAVLTHDGARWTAIVAEEGRARRIVAGGGVDSPQRLASRIPGNAVVAAAAHDFGAELGALPYAPLVERGFGLRLDDVASATPGNAVLYVGAGVPIPTLTLVAEGGTFRAAARVVRELDPLAQPATPVTIGGVRLNDVTFGAVDLYYGRDGSDLVLTNDSAFDPRPPQTLEPPGLPASTSAWLYVDAERAPAALQSLAALAGTAFSPRLLRELNGLRSVLVFVTHTRRTTTTTVSVQPRT